MEEKAMTAAMGVQRRSLCTWTGMAIGFRVFCTVVIDGGQLFGSAWISVLAGMLFSVPAAVSLMALRQGKPTAAGGQALEDATGIWGGRLMGIVFFAVLAYDAGAVICLMSSAAKYVAMPEANRMLVRLATWAAAMMAALMGSAAAANAAVLWRRLAVVLIAILILSQTKYLRMSWLTPVLGGGSGEILRSALTSAGVFCFAEAGWLMMEPEHDRSGSAMLKCVIRCGLAAAAVALVLGMLIPGMTEEPPTRSFRIGRLLANDRAGLTLEMPYVVLLYSGMFTMLVFEMLAAAGGLRLAWSRLEWGRCIWAAGGAAALLAVSPWTEREVLTTISVWYFPLISLPVCLAGLSAWIGMKKKRQ